MVPQKFQEITFQLLYAIDVGDSIEGDLVPFLMGELSVSKKIVREAHLKAATVWKAREILDLELSKRSQEYALKRIGTVERNVLRLALFELLIEKNQQRKIIISEATRLTKKFSTLEAVAYVNAILDDSIPSQTAQTA